MRRGGREDRERVRGQAMRFKTPVGGLMKGEGPATDACC